MSTEGEATLDTTDNILIATEWNNGRFNTLEAQKKQQSGKADLTPTKKSTFIGIVGVLVVGGFIIFIIFITLVVRIIRRRRRAERPELVFLDESGTMATMMPFIFRETNATPVKQGLFDGGCSVSIPRLTSVGREYDNPPPYMESEPRRSRLAPKMRV